MLVARICRLRHREREMNEKGVSAMKFKKQFSLLLALCFVMMLLAGCSAANTSDAATSNATSAADEPSVKDINITEPDAEAPSAASDAEETAEETTEKGEYVAEQASLPLADGAALTYFCEMPSYMSMFNVNSYDDTEVFQYAEELTGVDIKFTIVNNESFATNFQLMVASGDIRLSVATSRASGCHTIKRRD